jgi:hypothetical protein
MDMRSGKAFVQGTLPPNQHGDSTFLVMVQNHVDLAASTWMDPDSEVFFQGPLLVYDRAQSVLFQVHKESCPEGHAALARRLRLEGPRGTANPARRKLYLRARREAAHLRVYMGALPEQRQSW